jgi:LysM repeat protein
LGYHTVRYRETLYCIGRAYAVSPWAIATENRLAYPYRLRVSQSLAIPNVPWKVGYGPVCARQFGGGVTPPPPPWGCRTRYIVRYGDTLYSIAWRYGTTVWALVVANHLPNPNWIFAGQSLCIP